MRNHVQCLLGPTVGGKGKIEARNKTFKAGQILENAGITFGLITDAPFVPIEGQLLQAALYVKNGLSREMALKCLTINNAIITDVYSRVGSLEPGKDADIVIWDGYPLDYYSSASTVLIEGKVVYQK